MNDKKTKTALVTGASRGIGRGIAIALAQTGYDLMINCRQNQVLLDELKVELEDRFHITCFAFVGDVGDFDTARQMFTDASQLGMEPEVIVNNAGISYIGLLSDMDAGQWQDVIQTNLTSVFNCCNLGIPYLVSQKLGKIINISSVWGNVGASCEVAYSASKGGVNAFTRALAKELAPSNIQVNAIACGAIETEMNSFLEVSEKAALAEDIPSGRFGSVNEVGAFVVNLIKAPAYLTGQIINLDGGWI